MFVIDPGHIYLVDHPASGVKQVITYVKRSGGAITYEKEWPGVQTQAIMRAVIRHLGLFISHELGNEIYPLWQLGTTSVQYLTLGGESHLIEVIDVLSDRSLYLNNIIPCIETMDAYTHLTLAQEDIRLASVTKGESYHSAIHHMRMALWCYEARAYRRKMEKVNREKPTHDDTARLRAWRTNPADDVPFSEEDIEIRPIGPDGHIIL